MNTLRTLLLAVLALLALNNIASAHYNPTIGRWINRDPLGEEGGQNLYGFVLNRPPSAYDVLGLSVYALLQVPAGYWDPTKIKHEAQQKAAEDYVTKAKKNGTSHGYIVRYVDKDGKVVDQKFDDIDSWLKAVKGDVFDLRYKPGAAGETSKTYDEDLAILKDFAAKAKEPWDYVGYAKHGHDDAPDMVVYGNNAFAISRVNLFKALNDIPMANQRKMQISICKYDPKIQDWICATDGVLSGNFSSENAGCSSNLIWKTSQLTFEQIPP